MKKYRVTVNGTVYEVEVAPKFLAWRDGLHETPAQPAEAPKAPPADPNAVRELFVEYKF